MSLKYNLQFFAEGPGGEKTEEATPKKLEDARKEGKVAKSKELANGVGILALFLTLKFATGFMGRSFLGTFSEIYNRIPTVTVQYQGMVPENDFTVLIRYGLIRVLIICLPVFAVGYVVAFLCDFVQVQWHPTLKPLQPKFSNLNPINGVKRLFSVNSIVELIKALLKIFLIGIIVYTYVKDKAHYLFAMYDMTILQALDLILETVVELGIRISAVYAIISAGDLIYQRTKFKRDMRMTKQEVKDEYKQTEGDPQIKGKIRQRMQQASQRRMMQNVPKADVVITNPTHYAVAIQYDADMYPAPIVLAKGENYLAQKIKEAAKENQIEIVENKPLARMLYSSVEVGEMIPPELYQAVAEVLAFVYKLKGRV
ncbi:MAG: flagellar biosynthesis protein FlhB [Lachnospiraceae bacterium]|nr:flagellar biosynthesis protein FlhB [Lachnospiraceae bacterium]